MDTKTSFYPDRCDTRTERHVVSSCITSHQLARILLDLPDLPFCSSAHGSTYSERMNGCSHGPLMIGVLQSYAGDHIVVGDMLERIDNGANWKVKEILYEGEY